MDMSKGKKQEPSSLYGLINTKEEIELILNRLSKEGYIQTSFSDNEIQKCLIELKATRSHRILVSPADTSLEIELLLSILRRENILSRTLDTSEKIKSFISSLKNEGLITDSFTRSTTEYDSKNDVSDLE